MTIQQLIEHLDQLTELRFIGPGNKAIAPHFHLTEVTREDRHILDCGGHLQQETKVILQLWHALDYHHRLSPEKFKMILLQFQKQVDDSELEVLLEYQTDTIGRYGLSFSNGAFIMQSLKTDCRAKSECGIPVMEAVEAISDCCKPGSNCC
jgi:hypothetical protein